MGLQSIDKLIQRHVIALQDLKAAQAAEFLRHLEEARRTIEARVAMVPGASIDAFRMRSVLQEIDAALVVLKSRATATLLEGEKQALEMSLEHTAREMADLGKAFGDPILISLDAAKALSDPTRTLLAHQFETSVEKYGADLLSKARSRIIQGVLTGDSPMEMARSIASARTGPLGVVARSDATRLVRTEVSHAYGVAQVGAMKQAKSKTGAPLHKTWIHVGSYDCPICKKLNGTSRDLDGSWTFKSGKRTVTVATSPAHPNCVCRVIATKASWRNKLSQLGYLDKDSRIAA